MTRKPVCFWRGLEMAAHLLLLVTTAGVLPCRAQVPKIPGMSASSGNLGGEGSRHESGGASDDSAPFWVMQRLNAGLPPLHPPPDLTTPQASLENFILSGERGDFERAAYSLNLNGIEPERQPVQGRELAERLKAVMERQVWFHWDQIPDRPDGADDPEPGTEAKGATGPTRGLVLGRVYLGDRDVEIRLERLKTSQRPPVWVFARRTVEQVPALYRMYGPSGWQRSIPTFLKKTKFVDVALWQWIGFGIVLAVGSLLGWLVHKGMDVLPRRVDKAVVRALAAAFRGPGRWRSA